MLIKILLGLGFVILVILIVAAFQPSTYHVERSVMIAATAEDLFPHVNDLRKAQVWSPWMKLDPEAKYTFEGPPAGVGAVTAWAGNSKVGEGRQTIVESNPPVLVRSKLEFFKPMAGVSTVEYRLKPVGNQTTVTWSIDGTNDYIGKLMCLFMNMDKMIGGQFEKGLADLKTLAETASKKIGAAS